MHRRALAAVLVLVACTSDEPNGSSTRDADAGGFPPRPLCVEGKSVDGEYPKVAFDLAILGTPPDFAFEGEAGSIRLHDYFEPCADRSRLLVVRIGAPWCGTCRWDLAHTGEIRALDVGPRLAWLDLLVSNRDNDVPTLADLTEYRSLIDVPGALALDPGHQFAAVKARAPLPLYVLLDTRTMTIRNVASDPSPDRLAARIRYELASLDDAPSPSDPPAPRFDELFDRKQWDLLHAMTPPGAPPPDPTNAKADDPAAAALGKQLFSDAALSPSGKVACSSCHDPAKHFQDGVPQSTAGLAVLDRNSPAIALAAHDRWQFWDGRADTLWMQALGPFEDEKEIGSSRLFVAHSVVNRHASAYASVFGGVPDLADAARFPPSGKPGDASWQSMTDADRKVVTDLFVNVGKSIAAFERTLRVKPNRLDAYVAGDLAALTKEEKAGLAAFFHTGCVQCHWGPRLTDDAFHPDRYPTGRQDGQADRGRIDGIGKLLASEFAQPHPGLSAHDRQLGSFKTTGLRGVAHSAPFGHGGTIHRLEDVARIYGTAGIPEADPRAVGRTEPWLGQFAIQHADELVPFLRVLTADIAE
jgi:cytochrome c peroxidase